MVRVRPSPRPSLLAARGFISITHIHTHTPPRQGAGRGGVSQGTEGAGRREEKVKGKTRRVVCKEAKREPDEKQNNREPAGCVVVSLVFVASFFGVFKQNLRRARPFLLLFFYSNQSLSVTAGILTESKIALDFWSSPSVRLRLVGWLVVGWSSVQGQGTTVLLVSSLFLLLLLC